MDPHANVHLMGDLANYQLEGDAVHAMNELYNRLFKQGDHFLRDKPADAQLLGAPAMVRHWTCPKPNQSLFFIATENGGNWQVDIYAYGKHYGDNNKKYSLYTCTHGGKSKVYSF